MKKTMIHLQGILVLWVLLSFSAIGQERWYTHFSLGGSTEFALDVVEAHDGGYMASGGYSSKGFLAKLDPNGMVQWQRTYSNLGFVTSIVATPDSGYVAASTGASTARIAKVDQYGDIVWHASYAFGGTNHYTEEVHLTPNNELLTIGSVYDGSLYRTFLLALNLNGDTLWAKTYSYNGGSGILGYSVEEADNNDYMLLVKRSATNWRAMRVNNVGDSLSSVSIPNPNSPQINQNHDAFQRTSDGGYMFVDYHYNTSGDIRFHKLDSQGNELWANTIPSAGVNTDVRAVVEAPDGGYVAAGFIAGYAQISLVKINSGGTHQWTRTYDFNAGGNDAPESIILNSYGGYTIAGYGDGANRALVMSVDSLGNLYSNHVTGMAYRDTSNNCVQDAGEAGVGNWVVQLQGNNGTYYATTDQNGAYEIFADSGIYALSINPIGPYWDASSCSNNSRSIVCPSAINGVYTVVQEDFPQDDTLTCPYLMVDVSTPMLRRCFDNVYTVSYCNYGTLDETGAYIVIEFDEYLEVDTLTIPVPWSVDTNGVFTFQIGALAIDSCGSFTIDTYLDCDSTVLGQTHCVEAHIFRDSLCLPVDPNWDGAIIDVELRCITNDSVEFIIENVGSGNMAAPLNYYVTEDNIMLYNNAFQLNSGQQLVFYEPANGSTYRLQAAQTPGYPGYKIPAVTIEGCGVNGQGAFTTGLFNTLPQDDIAPFVSMDCQENIGAYDPNDKRVYPSGVGVEHYITANDELEYHIRFQNTGTDTAFTVVIRDTLSPYLDPATVISGASSHAYQFRMYENTILEWTFNNILLPDSNINEPASHGFVKFKVQQQPGNPTGTVIENSAAIYFDYNVPVITNTAFNTIGENFIVLDVNEALKERANISIYPNPFTTQATIQLGAMYKEVEFEVYNLTGKRVRNEHWEHINQFEFKRNQLPSGIYLFRLHSNGEVIGTGKLVLQ